MDGTQAHTYGHHECQPDGHAHGGPPGAHAPPEQNETHQCVERHDQKCVGQDFGMSGQDVDAQGDGADDHIDDRYKWTGSLLLLLANHDLGNGQQQWQPGGSGDDHGEYDADQEKGAELVGDAGDEGWKAPLAQHSPEYVHKDPCQPELHHGEQAVGTGQRQYVEQDAQGVEG